MFKKYKRFALMSLVFIGFGLNSVQKQCNPNDPLGDCFFDETSE